MWQQHQAPLHQVVGMGGRGGLHLGDEAYARCSPHAAIQASPKVDKPVSGRIQVSTYRAPRRIRSLLGVRCPPPTSYLTIILASPSSRPICLAQPASDETPPSLSYRLLSSPPMPMAQRARPASASPATPFDRATCMYVRVYVLLPFVRLLARRGQTWGWYPVWRITYGYNRSRLSRTPSCIYST